MNKGMVILTLAVFALALAIPAFGAELLKSGLKPQTPAQRPASSQSTGESVKTMTITCPPQIQVRFGGRFPTPPDGWMADNVNPKDASFTNVYGRIHQNMLYCYYDIADNAGEITGIHRTAPAGYSCAMLQSNKGFLCTK